MDFTTEELNLILLGLQSIDISFKVQQSAQAFEMQQKIVALIKKVDAARTGSVTQTPAPEYGNKPTQ